ncbi:hypothetical protein BDR03DRAFT_1010581 [Suillus americanus]|nr:hypothetical protein BDR03DRAFT_1010581 [Suillus americanus]
MAGPDKGDPKAKKAKASKENADSDPDQVAEEFLVAVHTIACCVDLFCNAEKLLRVGFLLQQEQAAENGELEEPEGLRPLIADHPKSKQLTQIARKMNTIISGTHSDDATHLKAQISHYTTPEPLKEALKPTIYNGGSLSRPHVGINHPVLASFLCLILGLANFNKDPAQAQKFMEIMCHIFTGPSTALGDDSCSTHSCNVSLYDITTVEVVHIAYACIQASFGISNENKWAKADGKFNNQAFYYNIIDFICECKDRDWAEGLFKWWNKSLFMTMKVEHP